MSAASTEMSMVLCQREIQNVADDEDCERNWKDQLGNLVRSPLLVSLISHIIAIGNYCFEKGQNHEKLTDENPNVHRFDFVHLRQSAFHVLTFKQKLLAALRFQENYSVFM